ncbi:serine/threonine-protein kinase [Streptosporangium sp. NBC_01756]|uniref:serine/threonine-protein kinase n=1 Tax=Streptosporangium sp. NBC_01756 TaxID=2975950 RepID=UPI002DD7C644|nr:serine/threonine-protein kinase [Streptosporangium sp. NBC_01756]WSC83976.1 serine/threonine protein kinase [Streptosporangium sp. NBC_01756]
MADRRPLKPADPERIGDYLLTGVLGEGGQGIVYRARTPTGTPVAIKVLQAHTADDSGARRRLLREADIARRIAPFCTARVLDMGLHTDRPYIVSEYIPGITLHDLVATAGPRTGSGLHRLAVATLTSLAAIHRARIVHHDVKPANIILGPEGPVVIDFGVSRVLEHLTTRSGPFGTPAYMAPEQFAQQPAGPAADLFGWAATMVYAATGHLAFTDSTLPALMYAILTGPPDLTGVTDDLRPLLSACLNKHPHDRPSAATLLRHLTHDTPGDRSDHPSPHTPTAPKVPAELKTPQASAAPVDQASPTALKASAPSAAPAAPMDSENPAAATARKTPMTPEGGDSLRTAPPPVPPNSPAGMSAVPDAAARRRSRRRVLLTALTAAALIAAVLLWARTPKGNEASVRARPATPSGSSSGAPAPGVLSVAVGEVGGRVVAVSGGDDGTVRMWDPVTGRQTGTPLAGHAGGVLSVAVGQMSGRAVVVSGGDDGTVRVWDPVAGRQFGVSLGGHAGVVRSVAVGQVGGRAVVVSGGDDGTVGVWDPVAGRRVGPPLSGHVGVVRSVAFGQVGGRAIAVSSGDDGTVRVWDLAAGRQVGVPLTGQGRSVRSVAFGQVGGRAIAVSGGDDGTVRTWNIAVPDASPAISD